MPYKYYIVVEIVLYIEIAAESIEDGKGLCSLERDKYLYIY